MLVSCLQTEQQWQGRPQRALPCPCGQQRPLGCGRPLAGPSSWLSEAPCAKPPAGSQDALAIAGMLLEPVWCGSLAGAEKQDLPYAIAMQPHTQPLL